MRILVQRVKNAQVVVEDDTVGAIETGLVLLVGIHTDDDVRAVEFCSRKCANLRIFSDLNGQMNLSLLETGGSALAISQFTLYGECRRGRRPSFFDAAHPEVAEPLYNLFVSHLEKLGIVVARGIFGAHMVVAINNDGPVTVIIESP